MDLMLADKVALVAASSSGLGLAVAGQLVEEGARVAISGRFEERLAKAVAECNSRRPLEEMSAGGGHVAAFQADLTRPEDIRRLVAQTAERFGGIDIVITNAGGPPAGTFDTTSPDDWDTGYYLTLKSAVQLIREALPFLRKSAAGSVLTITSISAKQPIEGLLLSNAFRPALIGLTKSLADELGPQGIRVNSILPGWTVTERVTYLLTDRARRNGTRYEDEYEKIAGAIPLGRLGDPAEFGRVAAFLVSPAASYITGLMIQVDGGGYRGLL